MWRNKCTHVGTLQLYNIVKVITEYLWYKLFITILVGTSRITRRVVKLRKTVFLN